MRYLVCGLLTVIVAVIVGDVISNRTDKPSTEGMNPVQVVESYYNAFDELDYRMMGACVTPGIAQDDIGMAVDLFMYTRVRRACPHITWAETLSAQDWLESGTPPVDAFIFGITDRRIEQTGLSEGSGGTGYRVDYRLWITWEYSDENIAPLETAEMPQSRVYYYSDFVTLDCTEGIWRISEIHREQQPV
ncbi:MAG: hypothetical protein LBR47_01870 [Spirochaetaceae bacterium]|jgi:hypothetical protein|nr:hypothetical protein [Spirochaetaceae bacterium]